MFSSTNTLNQTNKPLQTKTKIQTNNKLQTKTQYSTLTSEKLFNQAVETYAKAKHQQDYLKAAKLFEMLIDRGIKHEDLFYNLGNAYFKAHKYGYAIYNYERALKIKPDFPDAAYNLKTARQIVAMQFKDSVVNFSEAKLWIKMVNWIDLHTLTLIFAALWFVFFGLLIYFYFLKKGILKLTLVVFSSIVGIALLIFSLLFAGRIIYENSYKYGIILPPEVSVLEAPQTASNSLFKIHSGFKVILGTEEKSWVKIVLPNGMEGWIEKKYIGRL